MSFVNNAQRSQNELQSFLIRHTPRTVMALRVSSLFLSLSLRVIDCFVCAHINFVLYSPLPLTHFIYNFQKPLTWCTAVSSFSFSHSSFFFRNFVVITLLCMPLCLHAGFALELFKTKSSGSYWQKKNCE